LIILSATTDSLEIISALVGASLTVDAHCSWNDYDGTSAFVPGRTNAAISTATTTTILAAPAGGHYRNAKTINIRNKHATLSAVITVQFNQNATLIELHKVTLAAGECLEYIEGVGFFVLGAANPVLALSLAADLANSVTLPQEVTGLTAAMGVGTWNFRYTIVYQTSVTTTGVRFSVNHSGTVTKFTYNWGYVDTTATASTAAATQAAVGAAAQVYGVFAARAKTTAGTGVTISADIANGDCQADIWGMAVVTVAGSIALYHGSETAAATTVMAGSSLIMTKVG
jgi:hypothetical protein